MLGNRIRIRNIHAHSVSPIGVPMLPVPKVFSWLSTSIGLVMRSVRGHERVERFGSFPRSDRCLFPLNLSSACSFTLLPPSQRRGHVLDVHTFGGRPRRLRYSLWRQVELVDAVPLARHSMPYASGCRHCQWSFWETCPFRCFY